MRNHRWLGVILSIALGSLALSAGAHAQRHPAAAGAQHGDHAPAIRFARPHADRPLPDGKLARGRRNIAAAWFSNPTARYRHFALGAEHEAETLVVSTTGRRVFLLTLPADSVFEDREPRIADVDGDGRDEVIVVRSYLKTGAALAIVAVRGDGLEIVAETPPIGQPFRWLNPAGVGDFDGDGRPDIALVRMPQIAGELEVWTLRNGTLVRTASGDDVSNHAAGSRHLKLSAVADFNGDGIADLAIPSFDRRALRFLAFQGGRPIEFARIALPAAAAEDFRLVEKDGRAAVAVGLNGGRTVVVEP
jgi:FG-GAP-like repeat